MTPISIAGRRLGVAAGLAACVLSACSGGGDAAPTTTIPATTSTTTVAPTTTVPATTTTTTSPRPPTTEPAPIDDVLRMPLTGVPVDDPAAIPQRPALAVKIDNANQARVNHTGLAVADIVFEELVEDNNTRYAAVFHSGDAEPVGPVRSGRSQDVALLSSLNEPLFAWSGGNPGVTRLIADSFLTDLNAQTNTRAYYRGPGRTPYNLYSSTAALWALTPADHPGGPGQQFQYQRPGEAFAGDPVSALDLAMQRRDIRWTWNPEMGAFDRWLDGELHVDATYGQIRAQNVVVMVVDYQPSVIDRRSPEAQLLGNGPVYVFSNGQLVRGRWVKSLEVARIRLIDDAGEPILLTPGRTWVELAPAIPSDDVANPDVELTWS